MTGPPAAALLRQAREYLSAGRVDAALAVAMEQLAATPDDLDTLQVYLACSLMTGRAQAAAGAAERAAALHGADSHTLHLAAVVLAQVDARDQACSLFAMLVRRHPEHAPLWYDRGIALHQFGDLDEALRSFEQAVALQPNFGDAWLNLANTQRDVTGALSSIEAYRRAALLDPRNIKALIGLAQALLLVRAHNEALAAATAAARLTPTDAQALCCLGDALRHCGRYTEAITAYDKALRHQPNDERTRVNRALALTGEKRHEEAYDDLLSVYQHGGCSPAVGASLLALAQRLAAWDHIEHFWRDSVVQGANSAQTNDAVFAQLSNPRASPADVLAGARAHMRGAFGDDSRTRPIGLVGVTVGRKPGRRLRVGYLSADLREHPVAFLMAGVFEQHDRRRHEVFALALGDATPDSPMRRRLQLACEHFVELNDLDLDAAEQRLRALELDLLVDLMGHTTGAMPGLLVRRIAPVQIAYLGFPATTGTPNVDYLIGDRWVTPPEHSAYYSEQLVRLPECYQANDDRREMAEQAPPRAALGLPPQRFVFCCLNQTQKITPVVFDIWMRILSRVPDSVLWLLGESDTVQANLRREAERRGVEGHRLVFATRTSYRDYLSRYRAADVFLDTWPFNAGTTASDALWAGLPVLTLSGGAFAGRMAESLLRTAGLPELVTHDTSTYENLAVALARHPDRLTALRKRLVANSKHGVLFDTRRFTRHLERAFDLMWQRHLANLPPAPIDVPALPPGD